MSTPIDPQQPQYNQPPQQHGLPQQAQYGQPPQYGGRPTNILAILSLVAAFVFPIAGIVLGVIAKKQIRQTGEQGEGLAQAGLILSIVFTALGLLVFIIAMVLLVTTGAFFVNVIGDLDSTNFPLPTPSPN